MGSPVAHTRRPQDFARFTLVDAVVHIIHTPYYFFDPSFMKINVIGTPYDLWRRTT
ncbi:MAG: hypothetical protein WEB06_16705 [Actinomycetota bacterium]